MALTKTINIDGQDVTLRASAAVPRIYRIKFNRDIFRDLNMLQKVCEKNDEEMSYLDNLSLEMFENMLANQKRRISILSDSLKNRGDSISKLFTLVTYLNKQLDEKDSQIKSLREEVENKNFNIAQLRKRVSSLNEANTQLSQKVEKQVEALNTQNQMFNEGYVKIGTKKELTSQIRICLPKLISVHLQKLQSTLAIPKY